MLWGADQIEDFQRLVVSGYASGCMGMNEPDQPGQSNLSPAAAAAMWQQHIQPLKNVCPQFITPATVSDTAGLNWMKSFFAACIDCSFNYLATHFYGTEAQDMINWLNLVHDTFGYDIWVTEFACTNFGEGGQPDQAQINAFMATVTAWMEQTAWVGKYFGFGFTQQLGGAAGGDSLMNTDGTLTNLGTSYVNS